jgi:Pentapeptide repeats (8 copies)
MKLIHLKGSIILLSAILLLMTKAVYGTHLPPITPVLPGEDHQHENHSGANFSFADLSDVNFSEGNFTETLFEDARLDRVLFIGATLDRALLRTQFTDGANFTEASLVNADLRGMGGTGVIFTDANLSGVDMDDSFFYFSDFRNVNFAGADLGEFTAEDSDFRGADLSAAINIDTLFPRSVYDSNTRFPSGYDPQGAGMTFVPEPASVSLLVASLIFAGFLRARVRAGVRGALPVAEKGMKGAHE